jgi:myosin heavy subunit
MNDLEDMTNLPDISEETISENLKLRFTKKEFYTYTGSILVALNPYERVPIYGPEEIKKYSNALLSHNKPHIFGNK